MAQPHQAQHAARCLAQAVWRLQQAAAGGGPHAPAADAALAAWQAIDSMNDAAIPMLGNWLGTG